MLTVKSQGPGRPNLGLLRQAYLDGILDGMTSNDPVEASKPVFEFMIRQFLGEEEVTKVFEAFDKAVDWARTSARKTIADYADVNELRAAEERRRTGGRVQTVKPGQSAQSTP